MGANSSRVRLVLRKIVTIFIGAKCLMTWRKFNKKFS
jgi:hypothetical protein